jgi:MEDS: MEthanogen/methylotroph, DcmR Sensory domain
MNENRAAERVHTHHHAVQFYGDETELFKTIGTFLSEGLVVGQPAVVIATPSHSAAIQVALSSHLIDVARARHLGDLVMLDAEETLGAFMHNGTPDRILFKRHVGDLIEQTLRGRERTPIRAYGEMVDVLWRRGETDAAIRLEVLWNDLASTHTFSLLCGYAIGNFYKEASRLEEVCRQHTHVLGADVLPIDGSNDIRALG